MDVVKVSMYKEIFNLFVHQLALHPRGGYLPFLFMCFCPYNSLVEHCDISKYKFGMVNDTYVLVMIILVWYGK
jgi:hypothetical protein